MADGTRRLQVEFVGDTSKLEKELAGLKKQLKGVDSAANDVGSSGKSADKGLSSLKATAIGAGAAFGVVGLAGGITSAIDAFRESKAIGKQTQAVIKATGGAAHITAGQVGDLATALSKKTGIDDEAIQKGANLLLTFKNIRNEAGAGKDIFNQTTKAALDLSKAGFGSIESASKMLGKALNDPVKGITALNRAGVQLTEKQKGQIKALIGTGKASDRLKAQQIILKEVNGQVGGSAEAQATSMDKLKVTLGNLQESVGGLLVPTIDTLAKGLLGVVTAAGGVITVIGSIIGWFKDGSLAAQALAGFLAVIAIGIATALVPAMIALVAESALVVGGLIAQTAAWVALNAVMLLNPFTLIVIAIGALVAALIIAYNKSETFRDIVNGAFNAVKTVATTVFPWITTKASDAFTWIKDHWVLITSILTGPIGAAVIQIAKHWGSIQTAATTAWNTMKSTATTAWDAVKGVIVKPIGEAVGAIKDLFSGKDGLTAWLSDRWATITRGVTGFGGDVKDAAVTAFKGVANTIIGFINAIIGAINALPGVPNIGKVAELATGGVHGGPQAHGMASGGAFRKTGGVINSPITMMGEEAPRHPEFVIPTNPAYKDRAKTLIAQAANAVGLAQGGEWWGSPGATSKLSATVFPPGVFGWGLAKGGIFGGIGSAFNAIKDVAVGGWDELTGWMPKLPSLPNLPAWIAGTAQWALEHFVPWAKKNAGPIPKMQAFGDRMAAKNMPYVYGGGHGGWGEGPFDCSGFVSAILHAGGLLSSPQSTDGLKVWGRPGDGAVTVGVRGSTGPNAHTNIKVGDKFYESGGGGNGAHVMGGWNGVFPIHRTTELAKGGVYGPYVGTFHNGGVTPSAGLANVEGGELVLPNDGTSVVINASGPTLNDIIDVRIMSANRAQSQYGRAGVAR